MLTEQQIIENNILIAEFMEYEKDNDTPFYNIGILNPRTLSIRRHHEEQLCFEQSWDWLMPVISTLERLFEHTNYNFRSTINFNDISISYNSVLKHILIYNSWSRKVETNIGRVGEMI